MPSPKVKAMATIRISKGELIAERQQKREREKGRERWARAREGGVR
jgi:hypothetical protein